MVKVPPRRGACASATDGAASPAAEPAPQSFRRSRRARTGWVSMGSGSSGSDPCASPGALFLPEGSPASQLRYPPPVSPAWRILLIAVWLAGSSLPSALAEPAKPQTPIKHLVVIFQEN